MISRSEFGSLSNACVDQPGSGLLIEKVNIAGFERQRLAGRIHHRFRHCFEDSNANILLIRFGLIRFFFNGLFGR